jgi:hypothetical protein
MSKSQSKKFDWEVIQVILIVGTLPAMLLIGALFYPLFSPNY